MKDINQQEYSEFILEGIKESIPELLNSFRFESDILVIEYPSKNKTLTLWLSTQDFEITIGFDQDGNCIWHTHMSLFGAYEPEDELKAAIKFIKGVFTGNQKIVTNIKNEIHFTDSPDDIEKTKNEVQIRTWKDY